MQTPLPLSIGVVHLEAVFREWAFTPEVHIEPLRSQIIVRASHTLFGKLGLAVTEQGGPAGGRGW